MKRLKVCRKTVYNAQKQFQESSTTSGNGVPERTLTVLTKTIILAKKKKIEVKSVENCQKIAKYAGTSRISKLRVLMDNLQ